MLKKNLKTWTLFMVLAMSVLFASCSSDADDDDTTAPSAVTELSVTAANGKAVLKWTNPKESDFYATRIVISPKPQEGNETVVVEGKAGAASSAVINGLANDTEYTFTLYALDKVLNDSKPETKTATPTDPSDKTAPAPVTALDVTTENGVATVTWENPSDADLYAIWIEVSPVLEGENSAMIIEGKSDKTGSVEFKGLKDDTEYTFSVYAADMSLNFSTVTEKTITTGSAAPGKVTDIKVTASNAKAVLTWTNPSDSDFYATKIVITPKPKEGNASVVVEGSAKESSSTIVYGLTNGTEYTFTLYAVDKALNASEAESKTGKPTDPTDKTAPASVKSLSASAKNGTAKLTWTNPSDTDLYAIWIEVSPELEEGNSAVIIEGKAGESGSVDFEGLKDGTEYTFSVYAVDESLNFSDAATVKATSKTTSAGEVTDLKVSYMNDSTENLVKAVLEWKDPEDETLAFVKVNCYEVDSAGTENLKGTVYVKPGFEGFIATGLTSGSEYKFTVNTIDENLKESTGVSTESIKVEYVKSDLSVTLTPETTKITNGNVKVTVTANGTATKITYVKGLKTVAAEILSGEDITSDGCFTAKESGYYTVAVKDLTATVTAVICIENIDKTAPVAPEKLSAAYSYAKQKITFTWDSSDGDISYYLVSYEKAGESVKTKEKVATKTYEATGIDADETGVEYTFSVKAVDEAGNTGDVATVSVTPKCPVITGFNIPKAGTHSKGNSVTATVTGNNFRASGINASDFVLSCDSASIVNSAVVKIESNTKLTVALTIPEQKGSYNVTIKDAKEKNSKTGIFEVTNTSGWEVGDYIVAIDNGKDFLHFGANTTIETMMTLSRAVVAVVAGFGENGSSILALGVHRSEFQTRWAGTYPGIGIDFEEIKKDDADGSDNWAYICKKDPDGTKNPGSNYPAFYFAENYGSKYGYVGEIASGWYIPTVKEFSEIAKNYGTFKKNFEAAGGFGLTSEYDRFWTSCQSDYARSAYTCYLNNGFIGGVNRDGQAYVLVVKAFTADEK